MLNYSFSTVLMTVLASNLLIAVIVLCFQNQKILLSVGYKLVIVFLVLTMLRFLFPFELSFAKSINYYGGLSAVVAFVRHVFFSFGPFRLSIWFLLECVWAGGTAYFLLRLYRRKKTFERYINRYGRYVNDREPYRSVLEKIGGKRNNHIWVMEVPYFGTPVQYGTIRPYVVMPSDLSLTEQDLYYVLRHETAHYYHHDSLFKDVIGIIRAIYWWNPFSKHLERQTDSLLEMRVDDKLVNGDPATRDAYCETLDRIRRMLSEEEKVPGAEAGISLARDDLQYRFDMMYRDKKVGKRLFCALAGLVAVVYVLSYCFILEPHYMPPEHTEALQYISRDCYVIPLEDGTYDVYVKGHFVENVDNIEHYRESFTVREE